MSHSPNTGRHLVRQEVANFLHGLCLVLAAASTDNERIMARVMAHYEERVDGFSKCRF